VDALVEINRYLEFWLLRYRLQRGLNWSGRGLLAGLLLGMLLAVWVVPQTLLLLAQFIQLSIGLALASTGLAGLAGYFWPVNRTNSMRYFDRRFNLHERVSTAIEYSRPDMPENRLLSIQREDALEHVRRVDLGISLPWRLPWLELGAAIVLILLLAGLSVRNQPYFLAAIQKHNLIKLIQEQAAGLEEIQSNIQKIEQLSPEQRGALEDPLEEAASSLASAQSLEEALSALNQAEQALRALATDELQNQAAGLEEAGRSISSQEGSPLEAFGRQLAEGDFPRAAETLASLDPATLSAEQQGNLANSLETAAGVLANSNPALAQALQNAAEDLQSGDPSAGRQALSQAAQQLYDQASSQAAANAASQAAAQLSASQQNLAQAGSLTNPQANASGQASSGQNSGGQNAGQDPGNNPASGGTGSDSGESPGGSSAGAEQGESQGGESDGGQAGSQPIGTANQPGDGGERGYESVYAPQRLNSETSEEVQLPGSGQEGQVIGEAGQTPGTTPEQSLLPYSEVFPAYETVIRQAIESGQVPQHLRALVRDYFSSLAP
jgi:hypothetical protein